MKFVLGCVKVTGRARNTTIGDCSVVVATKRLELVRASRAIIAMTTDRSTFNRNKKDT